MLALIVTGILLLWAPPAGTQTAFQGLFVVDQFGGFLKVLVLLGSALTIVMSLDYIERENMRAVRIPGAPAVRHARHADDAVGE